MIEISYRVSGYSGETKDGRIIERDHFGVMIPVNSETGLFLFKGVANSTYFDQGISLKLHSIKYAMVTTDRRANEMAYDRFHHTFKYFPTLEHGIWMTAPKGKKVFGVYRMDEILDRPWPDTEKAKVIQIVL